MMNNTPTKVNSADHSFAQSKTQALQENPNLDLIFEEISEKREIVPPPRIAARFYRPTISRRKPSAASSRRNSISSAHSYQSNTCNREAQSSFFAQHQRRNNIIEDRKARLADRAAHVEKVRLRAAFFKAAPRSTTNSEERALAAQQAREKNLADIVAACAEEVRRAKEIAETMKEKREADGKRLRKDMEERLAEAEKRREKNLRRCSSIKRRCSLSNSYKILTAQENELMNIAASRIQRQWRTYQRKKIVKQFSTLGLSIERVKQESFDYVAGLLEQVNVLTTMARLLRVCGLKYTEGRSVSEMISVKAFLSAYLITGHPRQTLSTRIEIKDIQYKETCPLIKDDLENIQVQDLVNKARNLLITFEHTVIRLNNLNKYLPSLTQQSSLSQNYASFFDAFVAWKARDSEALIEVLLLQFIELEKIWLSVKDISEKTVAESYKDGIRENQIMLMARIKRLAGEKRYKDAISKALQEAHASRSARKPLKQTQSFATIPNESSKESADRLKIAEKAMAAALHTLIPKTQPQSTVISKADVIRFAQPVMQDNRIVTHEIAIDREYRIGEEFLADKNTSMQSAFENMRNDIKAGNSDIWVLAMAENVQKKLQRLLTEGKPMYDSIGEWLNQSFIATQLRHQSFSFNNFFDEIGRLLPKLCAPFRDKQIKEIIQKKFQDNDVVSRLEALMHALDILQIDYANFLLQRQTPLILANAAQYETYQFMQQLAEPGGSLRSTEAAWKKAQDKVIAEVSKRDPENINKPINEKIYIQMLVDVFTIPAHENEIPETLQLDKHRILRIRDEIRRIVTCGAILLQCKNLLKRDVRSLWKTEGTRIYLVLENSKSQEQAAQGIQAALESYRSMPIATKDYIQNFVVNRAIEAFSSRQSYPKEPVIHLLLRRLSGYILTRLGTRTEKEKTKAANATSESLVSLGLPEFSQKVGEIIHEIGRVAAVDREAHGRWYEQIIEKYSNEQIENSDQMDIDMSLTR
ncbi:putative iq calmodulin-binding motif domain protein [Golovinomyces cichoracearum]|uniref:Putative iq calmodulin-binding motif domain protein n=1 Tax=Golovinomyces cichoracearum TaxID=62708 RepID=A0A420HFV4_9PEZI|nr:putative iq calmodulin-binding motif domain protein [Golovinomyces cichoracearum]